MVKIDAFKIVFKEDFERSRIEGQAQGIIKMGREFGLTDSDIISRLVSILKCSQSEAEGIFHDAEASGQPHVGFDEPL